MTRAASGTRWGLAVPALAMIALGVFGPSLIMMGYSLMTAGTYGGVELPLTLDAYREFVFEEDLFGTSVFTATNIQIFGRSMLVSAVATLICLLVGVPAAYWIATRHEQTRFYWLLLVTIPFWVSLLIRTLALLFLLRDNGPINDLLIAIGITDRALRLAYNDAAVCLGLAYSYLPFAVLPIYSAIERMDRRLIEAAHDLYASRTATLLHVILPCAARGIAAGSVLVFIPSLGSFLAADLLGGGQHLMIGNLISLQFLSGRDWPFGSALAVILLAVVIAAVWLLGRRQGQWGSGA
jgi:spermidine/putrescine transport system permease protein